MIMQAMIKYPHQLMFTLNLYECDMLLFHACQQENSILNENRVCVYVRWTEKSGNNFDSIG